MIAAVMVLLFLLYACYLELAKNTLVGWGIAIAAFPVFFLLRRRGLQLHSWSAGKGFAWLAALLVVLAANAFLTRPPVRRVKAYEGRRPEVTDVVRVAQGDLTGVYNPERTVRVYAGIPYAKPPVGELRWKAPKEPEAWEGVRACDTFGPMAMQQQGNELYQSLYRILGFHDYRISLHDQSREERSEDCLYLNVYAPARESVHPLPVLFYVHGGSLMTGQSYYSEYRGEDLASQGIIVVNFAYRLGVFGYYAHEDLAAESEQGTTGNYGLLDQIAALKWVRENIAAFGGDPDQITIAGESAGASSVNALCVSPLTKGMFQRAIAESSGIVARKPYHTFRPMADALSMGKAIMEEMGAADISQMRGIPAERLVETKYQNSAMTVDGYALTKMPYLSYENGENHEQALLNGFNAREADVFMLGIKATKENYQELLAPAFGSYAAEAAALVPAGSVPNERTFIVDAGGEAKGSLNYLYSAAWFTYSHELWSNYVAGQNRPVYEYWFTKTNRSLSCFHAGELPYAYGNLWRHPGIYDDADRELSRVMQAYWVNFVKTGDPNGEGLPEWKQREADAPQVIELGETIRMTEDPFREVYPLLDQYQCQY